MKPSLLHLLICCCFVSAAPLARPEAALDAAAVRSPYGRWSHGPPADSGYFPIAVWLQSPHNAPRYKAAGINLYVGLWRGPTASQLDELQAAGMQLICGLNSTARTRLDSSVIVGWMHGDEPDNAQSLGRGQGYGPPILPERIIQQYEQLRAADTTRPVLLNLGQGVAWDNYIGRGVRRNHPEDYARYVQGCDIASFDIYPAVHDSPDIAGHLEFVGRGVERLAHWSGPERIVWNCIECTHISNPEAIATPAQVRSEVWMALVHGSRGLIYFVHQFKPTFNEAALLDDPAMLEAVTVINRQIQELAPVLNCPSVPDSVRPQSRWPAGKEARLESSEPIAFMQKHVGGKGWLFAVNMTTNRVITAFTLPPPQGSTTSANAADIKVLHENRVLTRAGDTFEDNFSPYEVHLYSWPDGTRATAP